MRRHLPAPLTAALAFVAQAASAHPGHGLVGSHWHATDTLGLLVVGLLATAACWFTRGK